MSNRQPDRIAATLHATATLLWDAYVWDVPDSARYRWSLAGKLYRRLPNWLRRIAPRWLRRAYRRDAFADNAAKHSYLTANNPAYRDLVQGAEHRFLDMMEQELLNGYPTGEPVGLIWGQYEQPGA